MIIMVNTMIQSVIESESLIWILKDFISFRTDWCDHMSNTETETEKVILFVSTVICVYFHF